MIDRARETALKTLYKIDKNEGYSNIILNEELEKSKKNLSEKDIGLISEIVYGTITWRLTIDEIIKKASKILDIVLLIGMAIYFLLACILLGYCLLLINDYLNTIIALLGLLLGIGFFISFVCLIYHSVTSKEDNKENLEETKSK